MRVWEDRQTFDDLVVQNIIKCKVRRHPSIVYTFFLLQMKWMKFKIFTCCNLHSFHNFSFYTNFFKNILDKRIFLFIQKRNLTWHPRMFRVGPVTTSFVGARVCKRLMNQHFCLICCCLAFDCVCVEKW